MADADSQKTARQAQQPERPRETVREMYQRQIAAARAQGADRSQGKSQGYGR